MSIFSCVCWSSVYLLWKNVCLGLLPRLWLGCLIFCCWVLWTVCIFCKLSLVGLIICKYFLPFYRLSFCFMVFFGVQKLVTSISPIYLLLLLFLLPWETGLRKHWYDLCQRTFCLCSLLRVLWCHISFQSLGHFKFIFAYGLRVFVLTTLVYVWLSNFPNTTCWRLSFPHCIVLPPLLKINWLLVVGVWVYFWNLSSVPFIQCLFSCQYHAILINVAISSESLEGCASYFVLFPQDYFGNCGSLWFHIYFRSVCSSSVENVIGNLIKNCLKSVDCFG